MILFIQYGIETICDLTIPVVKEFNRSITSKYSLHKFYTDCRECLENII